MNYEIAFAFTSFVLILSIAFNFLSVFGINYIKAKLDLAIDGLEYYGEKGICFKNEYEEIIHCNQFANDILKVLRKKL